MGRSVFSGDFEELQEKNPELYKGFMENQFWRDLVGDPTHAAQALIIMKLFDFVTSGDPIRLVFIDLNEKESEAYNHLWLGDMTATVIGENYIYEEANFNTADPTLNTRITIIKCSDVESVEIYSRKGVDFYKESPFKLSDYYCKLVYREGNDTTARVLSFGLPENCGYTADQYEHLMSELISIAKEEIPNNKSKGSVY